MSETASPAAWANRLNKLLRLSEGGGEQQFPVDATFLSKNLPIELTEGRKIKKVYAKMDLGFDGCILPNPKMLNEYFVVYDDSIKSQGRKNFTIAHELGHFLMHSRLLAQSSAIMCSKDDIDGVTSEEKNIEFEASVFAANLLMPFDDFRLQIPDDHRVSFADLERTATRYGTSLLATTLRWLESTRRKSMFVLSRDGYICWAKWSNAAFKAGIYLKIKGLPPRAIPKTSVADQLLESTAGINTAYCKPNCWHTLECVEESLRIDHYDQIYTLLHF